MARPKHAGVQVLRLFRHALWRSTPGRGNRRNPKQERRCPKSATGLSGRIRWGAQLSANRDLPARWGHAMFDQSTPGTHENGADQVVADAETRSADRGREATVAILAPDPEVCRTSLGAEIRLLRAADVEVHILTGVFPAPPAVDAALPHVHWHPIPVLANGARAGDQSRALSKVARRLRGIQPGCLIGAGLEGALIAGLAQGLDEAVPRFGVFDEIEIEPVRGWSARLDVVGSMRRMAQRRLYSVALARLNGALFRAVEHRATLAAAGLLPGDLRTLVARSPLDVSQTPPLSLPPIGAGLVFLTAGPATRASGIEEFCACAEAIAQHGARARWRVLYVEGRGPDAVEIANLATARSPVEFIRLDKTAASTLANGNDAIVSRALADAHVVVFAPREVGPIDLAMAAIASGRPLIASDLDDLAPFVGASASADVQSVSGLQANGATVAPGDAQALANALTGVLRRPDRIPAMARQSRRLAETLFSRDVNENPALAFFGLGHLVADALARGGDHGVVPGPGGAHLAATAGAGTTDGVRIDGGPGSSAPNRPANAPEWRHVA